WNSILIDNKKSSADIARFILCEHNKLSSNEEKVLDSIDDVFRKYYSKEYYLSKLKNEMVDFL
ncbi:TPA: hypothetical protein ACGTR7_004498, partial [Vibrio parahaemolyticus]